MARLASQAKGGYYPTPPDEMALVCRRLVVQPGAKVNLFDPCAGAGAVLKQMAGDLAAKRAEVTTYGVELEPTRAEEAGKILEHVVRCGYELLRCTHGVFPAVWCNPPYDDDPLGLRKEIDFFCRLTEPGRHLQPEALVMLCIPQASLEDGALYIASRLHDIAVYRFTDANYPVFKQVVVFGYRGKSRRGKELKEVMEQIKALAQGGPEALPPLDASDGVTFQVPEAAGRVATFRGALLDPEEIARDVAASPAWQKVEDILLPASVRRTARLKRPVLPLKLTHYAVAIAAGAVGGNMGDHLLEGITRKVVDREENEGEGTKTVVETERHVTTIRVFSRQGVFDLENA